MPHATTFVSLLRCPFCVGALTQSSALELKPNGEIAYGILACTGCGFEYPVVAGIAILMAAHETIDSKFETTEVTLLDGPRVGELLSQLKAGDSASALASLLNPSKLGGNWFPQLEIDAVRNAELGAAASFEGDGSGSGGPRLGRLVRRAKRIAKKRLGKLVLPRARARLAEFLSKHEQDLSALDAIDLYYRRYSGAETYNYFAYRFGQPRHLAALSLALPLLDTSGPLLDLACGAGHITHFLRAARPNRTVIGLDRDFFRLWLAAHYTEPGAHYVCAPADRRLPFDDGAFGGIFCSDAFHYFLQRAAAVLELRRATAEDGVLVLARFGNVNVKPREGYELTPAGYERLLADLPHVFLGEDELVATYRARTTPDLSRRPISSELEQQKWLSLVASRNPAVFSAPKPLDHWPHAHGRLQINPIYREDARAPNGDVTLRFQFPSHWYQLENEGYRAYAPETCTVPGSVLRALAERAPHPELDSLVSRFVVIGMPERYASS